ncbi:MAG: imidazole glycerol phosphate synthase subunit HisH [Lachnospiraceae bacterium]|nr:imidazole glycerol phosphate synthase subunit HisH [Lachnospiraceae bacterium]
MTAIIDYGAGNIKSVENALHRLGGDPVLTADPAVILSADHVILPGVGAFGEAMERLHESGMDAVIRQAVQKGIPFLGICLGLQLLFDSSEESPGVQGLGILPGRILRLPEEGPAESSTVHYKVPEIGWNDLTYPRKGRLFVGVPEHSYVYFVHSYYLKADDPSIVTARTTYSTQIDASVEKDNVFACQFHPEKSERVGMQILTNFLQVSR